MALFIRTIEIARARTKIGFANLAYNMQRLIWPMAQEATDPLSTRSRSHR